MENVIEEDVSSNIFYLSSILAYNKDVVHNKTT